MRNFVKPLPLLVFVLIIEHMYPQQPGPQPQGPPPTPPTGQPQGYPGQPMQPPQATPADPWQLTPQQQPPQPSPAPLQPWQQPTTGYPAPQVPLTPDGIAPIDYLDQIAPKQKAARGFSRKQVGIIGGLILLGFIGFAIISVLQGSKPNIAGMSQQVTTRTATTAFIAKESQKKLRSRDLSALNTTIALQLTGSSASLTEAFAKAGVVVGNAKEAKADDTSEDTTKKLEEARLNGIFDRVYAREMAYRLTTIMLQLDAIHKTTTNAELRAYLETTYNDLKPLQEKLAAYDAKSS